MITQEYRYKIRVDKKFSKFAVYDQIKKMEVSEEFPSQKEAKEEIERLEK